MKESARRLGDFNTFLIVLREGRWNIDASMTNYILSHSCVSVLEQNTRNKQKMPGPEDSYAATVPP